MKVDKPEMKKKVQNLEAMLRNAKRLKAKEKEIKITYSFSWGGGH